MPVKPRKSNLITTVPCSRFKSKNKAASKTKVGQTKTTSGGKASGISGHEGVTKKRLRTPVSKPRAGYTLYSTDSEDQVGEVDKGLNRCADIVKQMLEVRKGAGKIPKGDHKVKPGVPPGGHPHRQALTREVIHPVDNQVQVTSPRQTNRPPVVIPTADMDAPSPQSKGQQPTLPVNQQPRFNKRLATSTPDPDKMENDVLDGNMAEGYCRKTPASELAGQNKFNIKPVVVINHGGLLQHILDQNPSHNSSRSPRDLRNHCLNSGVRRGGSLEPQHLQENSNFIHQTGQPASRSQMQATQHNTSPRNSQNSQNSIQMEQFSQYSGPISSEKHVGQSQINSRTGQVQVATSGPQFYSRGTDVHPEVEKGLDESEYQPLPNPQAVFQSYKGISPRTPDIPQQLRQSEGFFPVVGDEQNSPNPQRFQVSPFKDQHDRRVHAREINQYGDIPIPDHLGSLPVEGAGFEEPVRDSASLYSMSSGSSMNLQKQRQELGGNRSSLINSRDNITYTVPGVPQSQVYLDASTGTSNPQNLNYHVQGMMAKAPNAVAYGGSNSPWNSGYSGAGVPGNQGISVAGVSGNQGFGVAGVPANQGFGVAGVPANQGLGVAGVPVKQGFGVAGVPGNQGFGVADVPANQGFGFASVPANQGFGVAGVPGNQGIGVASVPGNHGFGVDGVPANQGFGVASVPGNQGFGVAGGPVNQGFGVADVSGNQGIGVAVAPGNQGLANRGYNGAELFRNPAFLNNDVAVPENVARNAFIVPGSTTYSGYISGRHNPQGRTDHMGQNVTGSAPSLPLNSDTDLNIRAEMDRALQPLIAENSQLRSELRSVNQQLKDMERQFANEQLKEKERESLNQQSKESYSELASKNLEKDLQVLAWSQNKVEMLEKALEEEQCHSDDLQTELRQCQRDLDQYKTDRQKLLVAVAERDSEKLKLRQENHQEVSRLRTEVQLQQKQAESYRLKLDASEKESHILAISLKQRDTEIDRLQEVVQTMKKSMSELIQDQSRRQSNSPLSGSFNLQRLERLLREGDVNGMDVVETSRGKGFSSQREVTAAVEDGIFESEFAHLTIDALAEHNERSSLNRDSVTNPPKDSLGLDERVLLPNQAQQELLEPSESATTTTLQDESVSTVKETDEYSAQIPGAASLPKKRVQFELSSGGVPESSQPPEDDNSTVYSEATSRYSVTDYFKKYPGGVTENGVNTAKKVPVPNSTSLPVKSNNSAKQNFSKGSNSVITEENGANVDRHSPAKVPNGRQIQPPLRDPFQSRDDDLNSVTSGVTFSSVSTLATVDESVFREGLANLDANIARLQESLSQKKALLST